MQPPRLRDGGRRTRNELYPLGEIPKKLVCEIGKGLTYNIAVGNSRISGEDWGNIFARAVNGEHPASSVGLTDVVVGRQAWSLKSVQHDKPHSCKTPLRIISGRNALSYSYGIHNPLDDLTRTGAAILEIWNERIRIALDQYDSLRTLILIRNMNTLEFSLFESEPHQYVPADFKWIINQNGNLEGHDQTTGEHRFIWQPSGSQFTIKYPVPASAIRFQLRNPPVLDFEKTVQQIGFSDDWVTIR